MAAANQVVFSPKKDPFSVCVYLILLEGKQKEIFLKVLWEMEVLSVLHRELFPLVFAVLRERKRDSWKRRRINLKLSRFQD